MKKAEALYGDRDIMLLILMAVLGLNRPASFGEIWKLLFVNDRISYFDFAVCIKRLVDNGQLSEDEKGCYAITEDGKVNFNNLEYLIPDDAKKLVLSEAVSQRAIERREANIIGSVTQVGEEEFDVTLGLDDDTGRIFRLQMVSPSRENAETMVRLFRADPEGIFGDILESLYKDRNKPKNT